MVRIETRFLQGMESREEASRPHKAGGDGAATRTSGSVSVAKRRSPTTPENHARETRLRVRRQPGTIYSNAECSALFLCRLTEAGTGRRKGRSIGTWRREGARRHPKGWVHHTLLTDIVCVPWMLKKRHPAFARRLRSAMADRISDDALWVSTEELKIAWHQEGQSDR